MYYTDDSELISKFINKLATALDADSKIEATVKFIDEKIAEYRAAIKQAQEDYSNGLLQTCVKVELETVNYNMIKVLTKVKELLENEG